MYYYIIIFVYVVREKLLKYRNKNGDTYGKDQIKYNNVNVINHNNINQNITINNNNNNNKFIIRDNTHYNNKSID